MGIQQHVLTPHSPDWSTVRDLLAKHSFPLQIRMIDEQLALPDEEPPGTWREVRVSTPQGMVTVRREERRLVFVTWGNADRALREAWNAVSWAFAEASGESVETEQGSFAPDKFRQIAELPKSLRLPSAEQI